MGELIGWQQQVLFTVSRIELPGAMQDAARIGLAGAPQDADLLTTPGMRWAFRRWVQGSPLRRAALAGLADMQGFGVELDDVDLAGRWLPIPRRRGGHQASRLVDQLEVEGIRVHPVLRHQRGRPAGRGPAHPHAPAERSGDSARAQGGSLCR